VTDRTWRRLQGQLGKGVTLRPLSVAPVASEAVAILPRPSRASETPTKATTIRSRAVPACTPNTRRDGQNVAPGAPVIVS
jgi:hypothetical protein